MASIFLRGNIYWIKYYENGKSIQKSLKTSEKRIASFKKNEIENRLAMGTSPLPQTNSPINKIIDGYILSCRGKNKPKTVREDESRIRRYIEWCGITRINQINELSLSKYIDHRATADKIGPTTKRLIMTNVITFINWAIRVNYLAENPLRKMPKFEKNKSLPRFLSKQEVQNVLKAAQKEDIFPEVATAIYSGVRFAELYRLTWGDINIERGEITVRISKSGEFRVIPMHDELKAILKPLVANKGQFCFAPEEPRENLFWKSPWKKFVRVRNRAHLYDIGWHTLRHTFASHLVMSGVDLVTVSKLLGHASIRTTMIYAHLSQEHIKESVKKLKF